VTAFRLLHFYFSKCSLASISASYNDTDTVISSIHADALAEANRSQYVTHLYNRKDDAIFWPPHNSCSHALINRLLVMLDRRDRRFVTTLESVASICMLFRKSIHRLNLPFRPQPSTD
jgi:hypothetical protein